MTREESERIFKALRRYYPSAKIYDDAERLEAYRSVLMRFDFAEVAAVGRDYIAVGKYFPDLPDLVGKLKPVDAPIAPRNSAANDPWIIEADKALDAEIEARGGVCALLHEYGGVVGETIRAHYPAECCKECRKVAVLGSCPYEGMLHKEE